MTAIANGPQSSGDTVVNLLAPAISDLAAPHGNAQSAYLRVADDIAARITSGELEAGIRLRAERELASYYKVSYGTIRHAASVLRARGMIRSVHGHGTFIAGG